MQFVLNLSLSSFHCFWAHENGEGRKLCMVPVAGAHSKQTQMKVNKFALRPAGSDPEVACQKKSFLKVSVSLGGFGPSVAHGKHSVRRRCVQATKNKAETCSLLDAIGRRSCCH